MLYNYFKIAWRNLLKHKFYTLINVFGLSVGITFTFLIGSYIHGELQVNKQLSNADNQYIIRSKWKNPDEGIELATLGPIAKTLTREYPNLVAGYYRYDAITVSVSKGDKHFREEVQAGDSTLLTMYDFPLLYGNAATAMRQPGSVLITEEKAIKYFGKTDVVGQSLTLHNFVGGKQEYLVTGVLKNLKNNSVTYLFSNPAGIFIRMGSLQGRGNAEADWTFPFMVSYIQLQPGITPQDLAKPVQRLLSTHTSPHFRENLTVYFTPLKNYYREASDGLVNKMILTLSAVTLFILLMALVNFVNISIGHSAIRLKEIGVRKVLGSLRRQIVGQFLAESILLAFFASILSIGFYEITRNFFARILEKPLDTVLSFFPYSIIIPLLFAVLIGFIAGIYPAFILSGLRSVDSMKGKLKSVKENVWFRRALIITQFSIALFVLTSSVIISEQVGYFFKKDTGFDKEGVVSVAVPRDWTPEGLAKMESARNEFAQLKDVEHTSLSYEIPNGNFGTQYGLYHPGQDSTQAINTQFLTADQHFAQTYGIKMLAGKFFSESGGKTSSHKIVINQATLKALHFESPEAAIGRQIRVHFFGAPLTISGVCQNFQFESMHKSVKPLAFMHVGVTNTYRYLTFRLKHKYIGKSIQSIETKWSELLPDAPFEYTFIDDTLRKLYSSEIQLKKASVVATILSVFILLLGVVGMVSMNVSRRTREIGVRKVLGASGLGIVMLFLKEFLVLIFGAAIISFPAVFWLMQKWLQTFAYRVTLSWEMFVAIIVAFITIVASLVFAQTYKAAAANPVKSLKGD